MGWFSSSGKEETAKHAVYFSAVDGLKKMYKEKIQPVEDMYKFNAINSPPLSDADFDAKPMVLLLGQYSTGKTSFISYILVCASLQAVTSDE